MKNAIAKILRSLANRLSPQPAGKVHPNLAVTRSRGAVIGLAQMAVQHMLTKKTPHPGVEHSVTVLVPEWEMKSETTVGEHKIFRLGAEVTTMRFGQFWRLEGIVEIRPKAPNCRNEKWELAKAEFALSRDGGVERVRFDAEAANYRELTHLERHLRYYFERLLEGDKRSNG